MQHLKLIVGLAVIAFDCLQLVEEPPGLSFLEYARVLSCVRGRESGGRGPVAWLVLELALHVVL